MGGFGSGKKSGRRTTGSVTSLDIRTMRHESMPGATAVTVTFNGVMTTIAITWTPCHYGGERGWWVCPQCGKRVAIVYMCRVWACRQCLGLAYQIDRTAKADKPFKRVNAVRDRLGWGGGVASPMGNKPKGMHWTTYGRLLGKLREHSQDAFISSRATIARIRQQTDKAMALLA
jgi:hypothetical protein